MHIQCIKSVRQSESLSMHGVCIMHHPLPLLRPCCCCRQYRLRSCKWPLRNHHEQSECTSKHACVLSPWRKKSDIAWRVKWRFNVIFCVHTFVCEYLFARECENRSRVCDSFASVYTCVMVSMWESHLFLIFQSHTLLFLYFRSDNLGFVLHRLPPLVNSRKVPPVSCVNVACLFFRCHVGSTWLCSYGQSPLHNETDKSQNNLIMSAEARINSFIQTPQRR